MKDIELTKDFLTERQFKIIQYDAYDKIKPEGEISFRTNHTSWGGGIIQGSTPILIYDVTNDDGIKQMLDEITKDKFGKSPLRYMYHYYTTHSFIPFHNDAIYLNAGTLFLNEEWHMDWGGWYLYESINCGMKAIKPEKNSFIFQYNNTSHGTTPVNPGAPYRVCLQMFFT